MKPRSGHVILYDEDCPLCRIYTGAFVRGGWLPADGRHPYGRIPAGWTENVDMVKASSEIALLNKDTGNVSYGVDAILKVIGERYPGFAGLFRRKPLYWLSRKVYFFISYNRKVIAAVKPSRPDAVQCVPAYNFSYRVAYLVFAWLITALVLTNYAHLLSEFLPAEGFFREGAIAGGQILFQGAVLLSTGRGKLMDYLGNMMTVSLMGALALLPVLILNAVWTVPPIPGLLYFLTIAGGMLIEHARRMKVLGLGLIPSLTWVGYRVMVVGILFMSERRLHAAASPDLF